MLIPGLKLLTYLPGIEFPVDVLAEESDRVVKRATRDELLYMIQNGLVVGVGSWKRIRHLRVCRQLKQAYAVRSKLKWRVTSEAGATTLREHLSTSTIIQHHKQRCAEWPHGGMA
jgi:hypothetical protein